jgi:hypothetical protein
MYFVYCSEFGKYRERTKHCAETKAGAQTIADRLNHEAEMHGAMDDLYYYVRKFTPRG